jgi:hypothetical protein
MKYAKALIHAVGGAGIVSTAQTLPAPYNLWVPIGIALVSLAGVIRVPNRNTTLGELEDDVRTVVKTVKAVEAANTPTVAYPAPPSAALGEALAILTPPAS